MNLRISNPFTGKNVFAENRCRVRHLLFFIALLLLTNACQKEDVKVQATPGKTVSAGIFELSFEAEHLLLPGSRAVDNIPAHEKILAMPMAGKSKVTVNVYEDGTSDWLIEEKKPKHDFTVKHLTPPNDRPKASITRIDRGGIGNFYDQNNTFLFRHQMDVPSFAETVANLRSNPAAIFAVMGIPPSERLDMLIASAKLKGAVVQNLGNDLISIRQEGGKVPDGQVRTSGASDFTSVALFHEKLGLLVGTTLYDLQQNVVSQTFFSYTLNAAKQMVPNILRTEVWDKHAVSGELVKSTSQIFFENVTLTVNN